jgi:hypothetical protein
MVGCPCGVSISYNDDVEYLYFLYVIMCLASMMTYLGFVVTLDVVSKGCVKVVLEISEL